MKFEVGFRFQVENPDAVARELVERRVVGDFMEQLVKQVVANRDSGELYITRTPVLGGGYEYAVTPAELSSRGERVYGPIEWQVHSAAAGWAP